MNGYYNVISTVNYPSFVQNTFRDIYFTDAENRWIDQAINNIAAVTETYRRALLFFALAQACLIKRPYNLFHRKNLYLRFAKVERSFGNKTSWDKSFEEWFRFFVGEANQAVFEGTSHCRAICRRYRRSGRGLRSRLPRSALHFTERNSNRLRGLLSLSRRLMPLRRMGKVESTGDQNIGEWCDASILGLTRLRIHSAFNDCFERFAQSTLVVSYRSDGIPSVEELRALMSRYKTDVRVSVFGDYRYALSTNTRSQEVLLIGT